MTMVAAVLCHRRPEFLYHCLRSIPSDVVVRVYEDEGGLTAENKEVVELCRPGSFFFMNPRRAGWGCSHNAFIGLADASQYGDRVMLVEDDVILESGAVDWHLLQPGWCALSRADSPIFSSLGTSWPVHSVAQLLEWVTVADYIVDIQAYCDKHFPQFPSYNPQFDGLLWRLVQARSLAVDKPEISLVRHVGSYGANTGNWHLQPVGTLQEKIEAAPLDDTLAIP